MTHEIRIQQLQVRNPDGDTMVQPFSAVIRGGETLALIGESGSGKTLSAKALVGLLPTGFTATGTLAIDGETIDLAADDRTWRTERGTRITLVLQDPFTSLSPVHRIGEQIGWTIDAHAGTRPSRAERDDRIRAALTEVRLDPDVASSYPHELSGGMRQRAAIAAALASQPSLVIADEPTTALDASNQAEILDLLGRLQRERGLGVLLISHDLGMVRDRSHDLLVMRRGEIVDRGSTGEVFAHPSSDYTRELLAADPMTALRRDGVGAFERDADRRAAAEGTGADGVAHELFPDVAEDGAEALGDRAADDVAKALGDRVAEDGSEVLGDRAADDGAKALGDRAADDVAKALSDRVAEDEPEVLGDRAAEDGAKALSDRAADDDAAGRSPDIPPVLRARGITKSFGARQVLHGIDLDVRGGELVGIVGESGSGKSTLMRCIAGLERQDAGTIEFDGVAVRPGRVDRTPEQTQIVFQDPYSTLNPMWTVRDTLAEALRAVGRPASEVTELLDLVGLGTEFLDRRPGRLSGGQRQRVAIARALAPRPRLLICDESVSALDVSVQARILELLRRLRDELGLAIALISHDLAVVAAVADRVVVLKDGRVVETGPTARVFADPADPYTRTLVAAALGESAPTEATGPALVDAPITIAARDGAAANREDQP